MPYSVAFAVPQGKDPAADPVFRAKMAAKTRVDPSGKYDDKTEIAITGGAKVKLRIAIDEPFIYVRYDMNPAFHGKDASQWEAAAREALDKYTAANGIQIKVGPTYEFGSRFNFHAETNRPAKRSPEAVAFAEKQAAEAVEFERLVAEEERKAEILSGRRAF